ncbi:SDR family NAD(P)-dependent oxidoreductase [Gordonia sp. SID5947]|uniref:SDR family NAD(P)-dependent oxidoreductase n=1 Tax=Gordonia sp. SID5947 TaxID=2690315 RepID=UPI00136B4A55|nr:SDR family NAD(P)-dependent oxidoreductase [Gordonia sp. SID5947]MYR07299.1 SDR family NAD(P)-dependent oxidoreductase [Gordonia sp. SID5947]
MIDVDRYGPWAVIAGGSEGVGAGFARLLADAGVNLVLIARKAGPLEDTATQMRRRGVEVRTLALDLTDPSSIEQIGSATDDIDVGLLIYNAGANSYGRSFLDGELDGFRTVLELNITSQLALVHRFGLRMRSAGRGGIILVGSMSGYLGSREQSIYGGVKAFGRIFAESLWLELRDHGVDVLELVLGVTRTPAMERAGLNFDIPGMRVAEPDDVAAEGLAHLTDGPVWIAGGNARGVEARNGMDRAALVSGADEAMRRMLPRDRSGR